MSRMWVLALALVVLVASSAPESAHAQAMPGRSSAHSLLGTAALTLDGAAKQYTQTQPTGGTHNDMGLILAGSVTLGIGFVTSVVFGAILPSDYLFIPVVGGVILAPIRRDAWGLSVGLGTFAIQTVGLALLIVGLVVSYPDEPVATCDLSIVEGPPVPAFSRGTW